MSDHAASDPIQRILGTADELSHTGSAAAPNRQRRDYSELLRAISRRARDEQIGEETIARVLGVPLQTIIRWLLKPRESND